MNIRRYIITLVSILTLIGVFYGGVMKAETIDELNQRIKETRKQVESLSKKASELQEKINTARGAKTTLESELKIVSQKIEKINITLQYTSLDIERTQLEIDQIDADVMLKEKQIIDQKEIIKNMLRTMYRQKSSNQIELLLMSNSLASFFTQLTQLGQIEAVITGKVQTLNQIKDELSLQKEEKQKKKDSLELLKQQLVVEAELLDDTQIQKNYILAETKNNEKRFQQLYAQAIQERINADANISKAETLIRKKLQEEGLKKLGGDGSFGWPVTSRYITAKFHDPSYPFKSIFQHSGVDIKASQGSAIYATQDGYVAKTVNGGLYGYSYILLVHGNEKSTVYGHVSKIFVSEDTYVVRGQKIALSGGTPGTAGAGRYTTGPHLHFEIRNKGIPIDPLQYLSSPILLD